MPPTALARVRPRVALIAPYMPEYCAEFAELAAETCEVMLFMPDRFFHANLCKANSRLNVVKLPWPRQRQVFRNAKFIVQLAGKVRGWAPDLVHILAPNLWLNWLPLLVGHRPLLMTLHDVQLHPGDTSSPLPRCVINPLVKASDAIIVHGEILRQLAVRVLHVRPERSFSFPHLPLKYYRDLASRRAFLRPEDGAIRVLFFGRIYEYKGLRYLVEAAPLVRRAVPNIRFIVAGSGTDFERCRTQIEALPYFETDNRFIPAEQCARLFAEADILVLPYVEGSQSGVLMSGLPFGLPVVASNVGEIGVTVKATGVGLLVPPKDPEALAAALIQLAKDKELRNQLSDNARRAMEAEFSNVALSRRLISVYDQIRTRVV
jgi:glycosyltransferase involved in cell wall biosynthesis